MFSWFVFLTISQCNKDLVCIITSQAFFSKKNRKPALGTYKRFLCGFDVTKLRTNLHVYFIFEY